MARLLVTSLLRTDWHGRISVFTNSPRPLFSSKHPAVEELVLDESSVSTWEQIVSLKFLLRNRLDLTGIGKVLFLDCDCIALRSLNNLMFGSWDIYTAPEPGRIVEFPFNGYLTEAEMPGLKSSPGLNGGSIGVRASCYNQVMAEWERIHASEPIRPSKMRDQHSWNRLILDTPIRHRPFSAGEIQFPFLHRAIYTDYRRAALVHAAGRSPEEKFSLLFGLWMEVFGRGLFSEIVTP